MEGFVILAIIAVVVLVASKGSNRPRHRSKGRFQQYPSPRKSASPRASPEDVAEEVWSLSGPCFVVDGDTVVIHGYSIRLSGIDAPEMDHPYGKNAKWYLVNLTKGHKITAVFHDEQTHAREVATCYLPDGRDLSAEMVKAGFAIDWPKFSGGKYRDLEVPEARKKMWRADARQKGRRPPKQNS